MNGVCHLGRGCTEAFSTAQQNTVTEYISWYFQGFEERSRSAASNRRGGADEGMALRPDGVMALGLDFEKRGRVKDFRMNSTMKPAVRV